MNNMTAQTQSQPSWEDLKNMILATSEQMKETDRRMQETDRRLQETDRMVQENAKHIREMDDRFFSQTGHIIEGLMEPSAIKMFQDKGYDINRCWKNFKKYSKEKGWKIEADLLLLDLTSSLRHPKIFVKEFFDGFVTFHDHCSGEEFSIERESDLYGSHCFGHSQHFVYA